LQLQTHLDEQLLKHNEEFVVISEELQSVRRLRHELPCSLKKVGRVYMPQFRKAAEKPLSRG